MKFNFKLVMLTFLFFAIFMVNNSSFGYAFNPSVQLLPENNLGITVWNWAGGLTSSFYDSCGLTLTYGINKSFEITFNIAELSLVPAFSYLNTSVMLRYDIANSNIIGISIKYLQNGIFSFIPQYHYVYDQDNFAFLFNLKLEFNTSDFTKPVISSYISPVYKIGDFAFYLEIDPLYNFDSGFQIDLLPGIYYQINDNNSLTLGVSLGDGNIINGISPAIAFWYSFSFGLQ